IANSEFWDILSFTGDSSNALRCEAGSIEGSVRCARPCQELGEQADCFGWLFLLDPVARAIDEVASQHPRAGPGLHRVEGAGLLVNTPVAGAGDEAGRHVDAAAGKQQELRPEALVGRAAVPLQPALEAGSLVLV